MMSRIFILPILLFLIEYYYLKKTSRALRLQFPRLPERIIKIVNTAIIIVSALYPLFLLTFYIIGKVQGLARPQIPDSAWVDYLLMYPFWIIFLILVQTILFYLILDAVRLLLLPFYRKHKDKWLYWQAKAVIIIAVFFIVYVPARTHNDFHSLSVRPVEYKSPDLPEALDNFRIAFISDIQADKYNNDARLQNYIDHVNAENPDLVLIAGDIITNTPDYIETAAQYIGKIKSKYGVYSCVGDHDNWAYREDNARSIREITAALAKNKAEMVDNENRFIDVKGTRIAITFITHTYARGITVDGLNGTILRHNAPFKIFLTHQPRPHLAESAAEAGYNLFLAGHTHGGQITFLFPFIDLSPTLIETRFVKGDFRIDDMLMIVTRGLGMSLVPIRYNSTPEITLITLSRAQ